MKSKKMILFLTTIVMGLTAGIFYCWSVSVTPGLALLPDKEYITAFQSLNRAILNPMFLLCFMGLVLLLPLSAFTTWHKPLSAAFWLLCAASLIYIIGVMGVTMAGNVPMNDALDKFNTAAASPSDLAAARAGFEARWNFLNNIRTVSCVLSFGLTIGAGMLR
jgi:uncharacterized membrane protein